MKNRYIGQWSSNSNVPVLGRHDKGNTGQVGQYKEPRTLMCQKVLASTEMPSCGLPTVKPLAFLKQEEIQNFM